MFFIDLRTKWSPILSLGFFLLDSTERLLDEVKVLSECVPTHASLASVDGNAAIEQRATTQVNRTTYQIQVLNMPLEDSEHPGDRDAGV